MKGDKYTISCTAACRIIILVSVTVLIRPLLVHKARDSASIESLDEVKTASDIGPNKAYLCGYKFWRFCEAVFPDYTCTKAGASYGTSNDILLIGMHSSCEYDSTFAGRVVYINGEPDEAERVSNSYYLGPLTDVDPRSMQFLFASMAALQIPESIQSFTQRPRNSGDGFLLYISRRCLLHREDAFVSFSRLGTVTSAGKCDGSTSALKKKAEKFNTISGDGPWTEAHKLYKNYKFGLAMENTNQHGYISEKILNAFMGGTVPIYYGTEDVFQVFNRAAFIYFDAKNPESTFEQVLFLLQNESEYERVLSQPILAEGAYERFFSLYGRGFLSGAIRDLLDLPRHPIEEDD